MSHSPPKGLAANLAFPEGTLVTAGEVEEDGHFTLGGRGSGEGNWIPGNYTIKLSGQFFPSGDDMLLRGGVFDLTYTATDGQTATCTVSLSGIRQR